MTEAEPRANSTTLPVRATQIGRHPPRALAQVVTDPSHTMAPVCRTFPSFAACSAPSCFCRAIQGVAGKRPIFSQPALFIDVPMFCMGPPVLCMGIFGFRAANNAG